MTFNNVGAYVALEWDDWLLAGEFSYTAASTNSRRRWTVALPWKTLQQIGSFTAGLALERTFEFEDDHGVFWWLKPTVEYSVTSTYGDVQMLAPISLNELGEVAIQAYSQTTVTGPVIHKLALGLHGGNDTLQLGLVYDRTVSQHGQGHGLQAPFTW